MVVRGPWRKPRPPPAREPIPSRSMNGSGTSWRTADSNPRSWCRTSGSRRRSRDPSDHLWRYKIVKGPYSNIVKLPNQ